MDKVEEVSKGGIVLARTQTEREQGSAVIGTVIEVGPDAWFDKPSHEWAKKGDRVMIAKFAGAAIDELYRFVNDEDILGIVVD
jgi:co-chaperonin GroES (HSP10)